MEGSTSVLMILGIFLVLVGSVLIMIEAFSVSPLWGVGCIFLPFVTLIFVALNWPATRNAVVLLVLGLAFGLGSRTLGSNAPIRESIGFGYLTGIRTVSEARPSTEPIPQLLRTVT